MPWLYTAVASSLALYELVDAIKLLSDGKFYLLGSHEFAPRNMASFESAASNITVLQTDLQFYTMWVGLAKLVAATGLAGSAASTEAPVRAFCSSGYSVALAVYFFTMAQPFGTLRDEKEIEGWLTSTLDAVMALLTLLFAAAAALEIAAAVSTTSSINSKKND